MNPPIFVLFDNGDVDAFATVEEAETYLCRYDDITSEQGRAWDATGLRLEPHNVDDGVRFSDSSAPAEGQELRRLLVRALASVNVDAPADGGLSEVVAMAADVFRPRSSAKPLLVLLAPLAIAGGIAVIAYRLFA